MNIHIKKNVLGIAAPVLVLGAIIMGAGIASAWTAPPASPPSNNVSAPLNVSATAQVKSGNLGVGIAGSPTQKLDVGGYVNATGYCVNGVCQNSFGGVRVQSGTLVIPGQQGNGIYTATAIFGTPFTSVVGSIISPLSWRLYPLCSNQDSYWRMSSTLTTLAITVASAQQYNACNGASINLVAWVVFGY